MSSSGAPHQNLYVQPSQPAGIPDNALWIPTQNDGTPLNVDTWLTFKGGQWRSFLPGAATAAQLSLRGYAAAQGALSTLGVSYEATDATITAGSNVLTSPTLAAVAQIGMIVLVELAGPLGGSTDFHSSLTGYVSAVDTVGNTVTLVTTPGGSTPANATNSQTVLPHTRAVVGWDNTTIISAWMDACNAQGKVGYLDPGRYLCGVIQKNYAPKLCGEPGLSTIVPCAFGGWLWQFTPSSGNMLELTSQALTADFLRSTSSTSSSDITMAAVPNTWQEGDLVYLWSPKSMWTGVADSASGNSQTVTSGEGTNGGFSGQATIMKIERILGTTQIRVMGTPSFDFKVADGATVTKIATTLDRPIITGIKYENKWNHRASGGFLWFQAAQDAVIDVETYGLGGSGCLLMSSWGCRVNMRATRGFDNDIGYSGSFPYGISCSGGTTHCDFRVMASGIRHATAILFSSSQIRVTGLAVGMLSTSFDCHEGTADVTFMDATAHGGKTGAFIARGRRISFFNCLADSCTNGFTVYNQGSVANNTDTSANDVIMQGCTVRNCRTGPYGNYGGAIAINHSYATGTAPTNNTYPTFSNIVIHNCVIDDCQGPAISVSASGVDQLRVTDLEVRNIGKSLAIGDRHVLSIQGDCNITRAFIDKIRVFDYNATPGPTELVSLPGAITDLTIGEVYSNLAGGLPISADHQWVHITGSPTGGTFTLTYAGQTTSALAFNASASTVQTALRALTAIGSAVTVVSGAPGTGTAFILRFTLGTESTPITASASLTGGTTPTVITRTSATANIRVLGPTIDVMRFGARADAIQVTGGSITSGSNLLSIPGGFQPTDVGKVVFVGGAGPTLNLTSTNGGTAVPRPYRGWIQSVANGVASIVTAKGGSTASNATTTQASATVTYGTNLYDALIAAIATGQSVSIPSGDFIFCGVVTSALTAKLSGQGHTTRIFMSNDFSSFQPPQGTGTTGPVMALGSNASAGDLTITLASTPTTINTGDILALTSTEVFEPLGTDSDGPATTKGEFVRVQQVQGAVVYLESQLADSYATASSAQVQGFGFAEGFEIADLRFVNATPNVVTYSAASPMALSQYGGSAGLFQFIRYRDVKLINIECERTSGGQIFLENCIDFEIHRYKQKDTSRLGTYGYGATVFGCQWGQMTNSVSRRSSALFNAEGFLGPVLGCAVMPTRWIDVRSCSAYEGNHESFLCHLSSEYVNFIDCRLYGSSFYPLETTHSPGFRLAGRRCKAIRPVIERMTGVGIYIAGKYCEVHDPIIHNLSADGLDKCRGIDIAGNNPGALNTIIRNVDFDTITQTATGAAGHGIVIASGAPGTRIIGRNEMRNVGGYGVWDGNGDVIVTHLDALNHGSSTSGFTPYLIQRDSASIPSPAPYKNLSATFGNSAARYCNRATAVYAKYAKITTTGTFVVPEGVSKVRARLVGGGGGGGGGGASSSSSANGGGGGAAGGHTVEVAIDVIGGETLTVNIGAGGAGGTAGVAPGGAGGNGVDGGTTNIVNGSSVSLAQTGIGSKGRGSTGSGGAAAAGGMYGTNSNASTGTTHPGSGGPGAVSSSGAANVVIGGAGGGTSTATNGGGAGGAQLVGSLFSIQTTGGNTGTAIGADGITATMPGCGGGGGGGGAAGTGNGGAGGAGANGMVELWW